MCHLRDYGGQAHIYIVTRSERSVVQCSQTVTEPFTEEERTTYHGHGYGEQQHDQVGRKQASAGQANDVSKQRLNENVELRCALEWTRRLQPALREIVWSGWENHADEHDSEGSADKHPRPHQRDFLEAPSAHPLKHWLDDKRNEQENPPDEEESVARDAGSLVRTWC